VLDEVPAEPLGAPVPVEDDRAPLPEGPCPSATRVASRFLVVSPREAYPVENAFDDDIESAWAVRDPVAGSEWIEVTFPSSVVVTELWLTTGFEKIHRRTGDLFPLNAHARRLSVVTEAGVERVDVLREQRSASIRLDVETRTVRIVFEEVWPGERWQDLSISEVRLRCLER
jgi:hypothetical protein